MMYLSFLGMLLVFAGTYLIMQQDKFLNRAGKYTFLVANLVWLAYATSAGEHALALQAAVCLYLCYRGVKEKPIIQNVNREVKKNHFDKGIKEIMRLKQLDDKLFGRNGKLTEDERLEYSRLSRTWHHIDIKSYFFEAYNFIEEENRTLKDIIGV